MGFKGTVKNWTCQILVTWNYSSIKSFNTLKLGKLANKYIVILMTNLKCAVLTPKYCFTTTT